MTSGSPRFLIVRLGSLGDIIHAIPVAAALREHMPQAGIDWMVDPRYVDVLNLVRCVDRKVPVDPRRNWSGLVRTLRELRHSRYDTAIDLQGLLKSAVLGRLAGAARTIGFPRAHLREPLARLLYTHTHDLGNRPHVIHKNLALLESIGVRERRIMFPLTIPDTPVVKDVRARWPDGYALINPGAAWPNKRWPADRFGALATALQERLALRSVVLWGPGEQSLASAVVIAASGAAELSPSTTITDLFGLAHGARMIVSGDSGPLHIAAACGTPLVGLFGPTFPERNGPWAESDITVSRAESCSCRYERRCRKAEPCIESISTDDVIEAAMRRMHAQRTMPSAP